MKYLMINGKKEKIPSFPHHKAFIYRCRQFFTAPSLMTHLTMSRFITLKELFQGWKNKCSIPRVILIDPTSSCNIKCKGCWAADYAHGDNISFEKLDDIMSQAGSLGINDCFLSGGEPLLRKNDIIKLCKSHPCMAFAAFTNATLIDEAFADEMKQLGNLTMFMSIEGTREETDFRRGAGVYDQVIDAMDLLRNRDIAFAFSACYHSKNYKTIASDEFLDFMREKGCWLGWLFNYMPVGSDADMSLVCTAEQRAYVHHKITDYCSRHEYTIIDFWNSGHTIFGCIAAGNGFVHINARGDVEPCAFCHYSDSNIHEVSLVEALQSPFFTAFRAAQPFSDNPLQSCPMRDVPDAIVKVVAAGGASSTHYASPETPAMLAAKTRPGAQDWEAVAHKIYEQMPPHIRGNFKTFIGYLDFKQKHTDRRRKAVEKDV